MKVLLDTNIVIHRETILPTNYSIGKLFYWLDELHYEKMIHPYSVAELRKANNERQQRIYDARLAAYTKMGSVAPQTDEFVELLSELPKNENDKVDNQLLCEVFCGRVDILITEDKRMIKKAETLGISDKVFTINAFITKASNENPELIEYKTLSVKNVYFGDIDVKSSFFDTFRDAYPNFDIWFAGKSNEKAYVCRDDKDDILGFLYLKTEFEDENYANIIPPFEPKKRLKVGTFKVESSGFRLGERFIKIIFDNAIERNVDEVYVTLFTDRPELMRLMDLLKSWGFYKHGTNKNNEIVLVKKMKQYDYSKNVQYNFPNLRYEHEKLFLPIEPQYHTKLLPDSILRNEVDLIGEEPQRYALKKAYISFSFNRNMRPGDFILVYRKGVNPGRKKYESVISTLGVIVEVKYDFKSKEDFLEYCKKRTVFTKDDLECIWRTKKDDLLVVSFICVGSLKKKVNLKFLWDNQIVSPGSGPRPFDRINDSQFDLILKEGETSFYIQGRDNKWHQFFCQ